MRTQATAVLLLVVVAVIVAAGEIPCRFAHLYTVSSLMSSPAARAEFMRSVCTWESQFHSDKVGINEASGLTYDGTQIDFDTGKPHTPLHDFSASSKESLHVSVLALALQGDSNAQLFINNGEAGFAAIKRSLILSDRKISSYEKFNQNYPGFGGFLPWFRVNDSGIVVFTDQMWKDHVPGLDNGRM